MKVYVYPADEHGCGHHRLIWPAEQLKKDGHDVTVVMPGARAIHLELRGDEPVSVRMPDDCDVAVFQRVTNRYMAKAIPLMRRRGIAVVVDIDDDLNSIDPRNPAWHALHPRNEGHIGANGQISHHSWHHLTEATKAATLVTVSAPALLNKYARHGRGAVIYNHLPDHYYGIEHVDSDVIGWPAALNSHPGDPAAVGNAIARMVNLNGAEFMVSTLPEGVGRAFGLSSDPSGVSALTSIYEWPRVVAEIGVGIAPLGQTMFNQSKSWLKPLEMCAVGVPWVGSALPEYERLHQYGCGLIAGNPKQWYRHLRDLVGSKDLRDEMAGKGREVADELSLRRNAHKYYEAWELAYKTQRS